MEYFTKILIILTQLSEQQSEQQSLHCLTASHLQLSTPSLLAKALNMLLDYQMTFLGGFSR